MEGYTYLNKQRFDVERESVFQIRGPYDEKLPSLKLVRTRGLVYRCVLLERKPLQLLLKAVGISVFARYDGHWRISSVCFHILMYRYY